MAKTTLSRPEARYLFDECSGHYLPQRFAREMNRCVIGVNQEQWNILETGQEHEFYWEVWDEVLHSAKIKDQATGIVYTFHQNAGIWAVPEGMEINEKGEFFWPEDAQDAQDA